MTDAATAAADAHLYASAITIVLLLSVFAVAIGWALDRWWALDETPLYADRPDGELAEERAA